MRSSSQGATQWGGGIASGSQPSVVSASRDSQLSVSALLNLPSWWPRNRKKEPITHVYRIMDRDMDDFRFEGRVFHILEPDDDDLRLEAMSLLAGNDPTDQSPYLSASLDFAALVRWCLAEGLLSGQPHPALSHVIAVRINIWAYYQSGEAPQQAVVDLSHHKAQQRFFTNPDLGAYGVDQDRAVTAIRCALSCKQVLLKWRGYIPIDFYERVDIATGEVLGPLENAIGELLDPRRPV